jgi:hypothetical protein
MTVECVRAMQLHPLRATPRLCCQCALLHASCAAAARALQWRPAVQRLPRQQAALAQTALNPSLPSLPARAARPTLPRQPPLRVGHQLAAPAESGRARGAPVASARTCVRI